MTFEEELEHLLNRYSKENESDTPDFILAQYLQQTLTVWNATTKERDRWWDHRHWGEPNIVLEGSVSMPGDPEGATT